MKNKETRIYDAQIELREAEDGNRVVGHAAVFDRMSENLGGFREVIAPGAFDGVLDNDVRALFNHDSNFVLARTKSGTLSLSTDDGGLVSDFELGGQSYAKDLRETMQRGDVDQMSFAFSVPKDGQRWEDGEDGIPVRTITKVSRLYDVSVVTYPAYPDASVGLRSLEEFRTEQEQEEEKEPEPTPEELAEAKREADEKEWAEKKQKWLERE